MGAASEYPSKTPPLLQDKSREVESAIGRHAGPRRGHRNGNVQEVIEDSGEPLCETTDRSRHSFRTIEKGTVSGTGKETSSDRQPNPTMTLDLPRQPPRSKATFTLFDRTMHFYGEVYFGNGTIMKSVINNQGGSISNSGGSMYLGNVAGPMSSGNVRRNRNFATNAFRSIANPPAVYLRRGLHYLRRLVL